MNIFFQLIINGLLLGGAYIIISLGLTLIFGVIRVVNFAHGVFLMAGMYLVYVLSAYFGIHPYISVFPAAIVLFGVGAAAQKLVIERLLDAGEEIQIFATVGVLTIFVNLALMVFGADFYSVRTSVGTGSISLGSYYVVTGRLVTFIVGIALAVSLSLFMHQTHLGRSLRAVAQNGYAARLMGVNVKFVYMIAFGLGTAFVGVAAGLLAPQYPVFPTVGSFFLLTTFVIVVLGGMGSLYGAVVGSLIIGVIDALAGYYISPDLKEVISFGIFLLVLVVRPQGLFGQGTE